MSTAAPIVTDLFHAVIRRMPEDPVAFCRHYLATVRDANQQLSSYDADPAAYNAQQDALALAQLQGSKRQPEPEPEPEMEPELTSGVVETAALIEGDDDQANAEAMFGQLYGAGLLGGPLEQHKEEAHRNGVFSFAPANRRRGRGGSYLDQLARDRVLEQSWGQRAKGRAAYSSDHDELFSITSARSATASRESRRTVSRGQQSRQSSRGGAGARGEEVKVPG